VGHSAFFGPSLAVDESFGFLADPTVVSVVSMLWILFAFCLNYLWFLWINPLDYSMIFGYVGLFGTSEPILPKFLSTQRLPSC
jgi:hypothetical protein